jgi:hypothetical protein
MASEINSMLHVGDFAHPAASNRETGGIMNMTRPMFSYAPQLGPSLVSFRRAAAGSDINPALRSRQRRKDWLSPATS